MMNDLISRRDAINTLKEYEIVESDNFTKTDLITMMTIGTIANCVEAIVDLPSVEPEQKRGKWVGYKAENKNWQRTDGSPIFLSCSECNETVMNNGSAHWNYCPNCGAKLDWSGNE
jgi:hypothetical protein